MPHKDTYIRFDERQTCTVKEACAAVPCGRTHLYKMIRAGLIQAEKFGSKTLVVIASLPGSTSRKAA
jgi:excisionase family DNA binding protein